MLSADGSVGSPHVRVGHRQDLLMKSRCRKDAAFYMAALFRWLPESCRQLYAIIRAQEEVI